MTAPAVTAPNKHAHMHMHRRTHEWMHARTHTQARTSHNPDTQTRNAEHAAAQQ